MQIIISLLVTLTLGFSLLQCSQIKVGGNIQNVNAANTNTVKTPPPKD